MKIRKKFFLILLAFSLVPLMVVTIINHYRTRAVGRTISEGIQEKMIATAEESLLLTAENHAEILMRTKSAMEFSLFAFAKEVEQALAHDPTGKTRIYFASDFDTPGRAPLDYKPSAAYLKRAENGRFIQGSVSFEHPVFLLAPGVPPQAVSTDINRLTRLTPAFQELAGMMGGVLQWAYVSLESGVHMSYPGHGGYPASYDGRKRTWYTNAGDHLTWSPPIVDATTGLVILTQSKKVYHPDGRFAGVVAMDVPITKVLRENELNAMWTSSMQSFLVASTLQPESGIPGLRVIAQKDYQAKATSWKSSIQMEWLSSPAQVRFREMVDNLNQGASRFVEMPYDGAPAFWAYAPIAEGLHFVVVVPKSVITQLPRQATRKIMALTNEQLLIITLTTIVCIGVMALASYFGSKATTITLLKLASAAERLAGGDFDVRINLRTGDERDKVIEAFNDMVPRLRDHLRIQHAMSLAKEIQQNLLPTEIPRVAGLDLAGKVIYCDETGGDYYDFLVTEKIRDAEVRIVVGDVSDHGIPSALLMATARSSLRQRSSLEGDISGIVTDVNRQFAADVVHTCQFMTLYYLSICMEKRQAKWVRAGHDPAILYDPQTDCFEALDGPGIALGVDKNWQYQEFEKSGLTKGQIIVLGTDGVWETRNAKDEMFSKPALYRIIRENAALSARGILDAVFNELNTFRSGERSEDDITLVVIRVDA